MVIKNNRKKRIIDKKKIIYKHKEFLLKMIPELDNAIDERETSLILKLFSLYFSIFDFLKISEKIENETRLSFIDTLRKFENSLNEDKLLRIFGLLNDEYFENLEAMLKDTIESSEDIILYDELNEDNLAEFNHDTSMTFLIDFEGVWHLIQYAKMHNLTTDDKVQEKLKRIENIFRNNFYHFRFLKAHFEIQKNVFQPSTDKWWYYDDPYSYKPEYPQIKLISQETTLELPCPDYEKIVRYAFDELSYSESKELEVHILSCPICFKEVIELRDSLQLIPPKPQSKRIPIRYRIDQIINNLKDIFEGKIADIFSPEVLPSPEPLKSLLIPSFSPLTKFVLLSQNYLKQIELKQFYHLKCSCIDDRLNLIIKSDEENLEIHLVDKIFSSLSQFFLKSYEIHDEKIKKIEIKKANSLFSVLREFKCPKNEVLFLLISESKDTLLKESVSFEKMLMKIIQNQDISESEINDIKKTIIFLIDLKVRE